MSFLIANKEEFIQSGIDRLDFIIVSGDGYVDHPSFGVAIIGRLLEYHGYTVGIIPQPKWTEKEAFEIYGEPKLGFLISAGNIDSMVNHYTVAKKKRSEELYSPNGEVGHRPDRATIVYGNKLRESYKNTPIILGGIEASLRRLSHYDYWDNKVRRSILLDSGGDLLVYGMGEKQIVEIADALKSGIDIKDITYVKGTVFKTKNESLLDSIDIINLPNYEDVLKNKLKYNESFKIQNDNTEFGTGKTLVERYGNIIVVQNPPVEPLTTSEFDKIYGLQYQRTYHPMYEDMGGIPAIKEVKFSIINNRGCFGNCRFCAITFHQGRVVQGRSCQSIVEEAKKFIWEEDFKGYIHDVGGPTANFREPACDKQSKLGACIGKDCLFPKPCDKLKIDHKEYLNILRKLRELPNVKKVFIRSGIRYDYLIHDKNDEFFNELVAHHVSGQLKVAPEHVSNKVLLKMGKPNKEVYEKFSEKFYKINKKKGKNQFLVPYLMSSHPGSQLEDAIELALYLKKHNLSPEQVQDFYPTPGTLSTCIFYTEIDPYTNEKVYVPKSKDEKAMQRGLIQYKNPKNYHLVKKALLKANREELIGFTKECLIRPIGGSYSHSLNKDAKKTFKPKDKKGKPFKKKTIRNVHKKK